MASSILHRGPDEVGMYRDQRAMLVSTRLSIVDLTTGQQPISNEDETLWVVFNGEIFNYVELRAELEAAGHRFLTRSDTEVVVHAYEHWDLSCFSRFNGQWALAIWQPGAKRILLCRDRVGVRPLFVCRGKRELWFGSEIKAIFADLQVEREMSPIGLDQTFTYWSSIPPYTVFRGIEEIPPGSYRLYDQDGNCREERYWEPRYLLEGEYTWKKPFPMTLAAASDELYAQLQRATRLRMLRADVPVGSYLSGGIDSSIVALLGREAKEGLFRTYSIRFEDEEFDETRYQRLMASRLDSEHQELLVSTRDIAEVFPSVIAHTERPVMRTAPAPLYLLSKLVHDSGIKAVLTGEGADEMLGGYDIFREAKIREFWGKQPDSDLRPRLFERLYPYLARSPQQTRTIALEFWRKGLHDAHSPWFSHEPRWQTTAALKRFFTSELRHAIALRPAEHPLFPLPSEFARWDGLSKAQYLEIQTLFSGYIISSQGDRMLMAHSVEGRFPFLDASVMEFCNGLPVEYKLALLKEKHVLKLMARGRIPQEIIDRPKQPYRAPDALSFLFPKPVECVRSSFSEDRLREFGVFDPRLAVALLNKCIHAVERDGRKALLSNSDNMAFIGILSTQLLCEHIADSKHRMISGSITFTKVVDRTGEVISNHGKA